MRRWLPILVVFAALAGCQSAGTDRTVAVGFTADEVRRAMGRPLRVDLAAGGETWLYRENPRNPNDYVRLGYRHRVEFDPVRRSNVIIVEPVDDREFPHLRARTIRIAFRDGRVTGVDSTEDL